jgi:AcrR family transcriptional regulator
LTRAGRRRQLLAHALRVFAERGYHGTTLELVAEVAGMPEGIVVRHFTDVPALFRGVLEEIRAATIERWEAETAVLPDPLTRLHAVAEAYLGAARADAPAVRLLHRALADCDGEAIAAPLRSFFEQCVTFVAAILGDGQQSGVFRRAQDPRVAAWQLLHVGLGRVATRQLGTAANDAVDSLAREIDCLFHGLLKTDV